MEIHNIKFNGNPFSCLVVTCRQMDRNKYTARIIDVFLETLAVNASKQRGKNSCLGNSKAMACYRTPLLSCLQQMRIFHFGGLRYFPCRNIKISEYLRPNSAFGKTKYRWKGRTLEILLSCDIRLMQQIFAKK
jgi:hypothetical protein